MPETKQRRKAPAEPVMPPNAEDFERPDWLPADSGLPWVDALRERHVAACREFARAVEVCGEIEDGSEDDARAWRRAVRDAVAVGEPPPERSFDPDAQQAQREVAEEDLVVSRDELSRVVADALDELRGRRSELDDVRLGVQLAASLGAGPEGGLAAAQRDIERQLQAARAGGVVDVADDANAAEFEPEAEMSNA
jgi:hypothetical protein